MSRSEELFAADLTDEHVGRDVVFALHGVATGGVLSGVRQLPRMERTLVDVESVPFSLPAGKPVTVTELSGRVPPPAPA